MARQDYRFGFALILIALFFYMLTPLACAPTKVRVYPRETSREKIVPPTPASKRTAQEKNGTAKIPPGEKGSIEIDKGEPSSERPSAEKISGVESPLQKTYDETISEWKSYEDLVKWMENDFSFDKERYGKFKGTLPVPRTPVETFQIKSGIYIDAAMFLKETLHRIDPSYKAQIVILIMRRHGFNHYACSFKKDGKLFIMDYGTPYKETTGVHGPYRSLEDYKKFYEKHHPMKGEIEAITYLR
jgi:hypothetical protein